MVLDAKEWRVIDKHNFKARRLTLK